MDFSSNSFLWTDKQLTLSKTFSCVDSNSHKTYLFLLKAQVCISPWKYKLSGQLKYFEDLSGMSNVPVQAATSHTIQKFVFNFLFC